MNKHNKNSNIARLGKINSDFEIINKTSITLGNGQTVFFATIKRDKPIQGVNHVDESLAELLKECKWCNGTGNDGGGYNACPDCESTGYVGGHYALELLDEQIEKDYQEFLKKEKEKDNDSTLHN